MLTPALFILLGAVLALALRHIIAAMLRLGLGLAVLAVLVRGVLLVEPRMAELDLVGPALIGILFGAVVIAAGWGVIWNSFVDDQYRDTVDKAGAVKKAKRLW